MTWIYFAWAAGGQLDCDAKKWRLIADFANDFGMRPFTWAVSSCNVWSRNLFRAIGSIRESLHELRIHYVCYYWKYWFVAILLCKLLSNAKLAQQRQLLGLLAAQRDSRWFSTLRRERMLRISLQKLVVRTCCVGCLVWFLECWYGCSNNFSLTCSNAVCEKVASFVGENALFGWITFVLFGALRKLATFKGVRETQFCNRPFCQLPSAIDNCSEDA